LRAINEGLSVLTLFTFPCLPRSPSQEGKFGYPEKHILYDLIAIQSPIFSRSSLQLSTRLNSNLDTTLFREKKRILPKSPQLLTPFFPLYIQDNAYPHSLGQHFEVVSTHSGYFLIHFQYNTSEQLRSQQKSEDKVREGLRKCYCNDETAGRDGRPPLTRWSAKYMCAVCV
jgi:hypothetical protein